MPETKGGPNKTVHYMRNGSRHCFLKQSPRL